MSYEQTKEKVINESPQQTEEGKMELYLYSLRKMAENNVESNKNGLTNLHNLKAFFYLCGELFRENLTKKFGVIVMDIAQFKSVNEFCGRSEGDRLLVFIAECLRHYEENRPLTHVCHIRADIFALCTAFQEKSELVEIVEDIRDRIQDFPFAYRVLPSFGICVTAESNPAISYLKDCATLALNSIKGKTFSTYAFFDDEMRRQMMREKQVENDIIPAIEKEELKLYVQPKVNMRTGRIVGGEALVRWMHPQRGLIAPGEFIPVLEKNGFIINVDAYIWRKVFAFLGKLKQENRPLVPISVNVSRVHAYDKNLCDTLMSLKKEYEVPAVYVPLELTESAFLEDEKGMYLRMKALRAQGFSISMDDFGTGYSTMNMLKNQPMDEIKIDRELIMDIDNPKSKVIVQHTVNMLKDLDTKTIVEGVETEDQKSFLLQSGCEYAQGFLFYKPMPVEEFDELLHQQEMSMEQKNGMELYK